MSRFNSWIGLVFRFGLYIHLYMMIISIQYVQIDIDVGGLQYAVSQCAHSTLCELQWPPMTKVRQGQSGSRYHTSQGSSYKLHSSSIQHQ
jgi:hypothetical protein